MNTVANALQEWASLASRTKKQRLIPMLATVLFATGLTGCGPGALSSENDQPKTVTASSAVSEGSAARRVNGSISTNPSFFGDWERGTVSGTGSGNWIRSELVAPDRLTVVRGADARQGEYYARVEVRPNDNPLTSCCVGTERAEVSGMQDGSGGAIEENESSGTQQYTVSVKFDPSWQTIIDYGSATGKWTGAWGIFLQLHGPDQLGTNPAWALSATDKIRLNLRVGDIENSTQPKGYDLSNGNVTIGKWIDFILTVRYAADNTGYISLLRRDEGEASYTQVLNLRNTPTLQYSSRINAGRIANHYIKHGLYRNSQPFSSILYLDGFSRTAVPQAQK